MLFNIKSTDCVWFDSLQEQYLTKLNKYNIKQITDGWGAKTYTIELNTLEELLQLQKELDVELIIDGDTIEIYDDYKES